MQMYWFHQLYKFQGDSIQNPPPAATPLTPNAETSPAMLYIIVILAIIFFISGLLHLLAKFITRHRPSSSDFPSNSGTFQRQLHQLFNLHDTGLDQEFIDALPVFQYKEILGLKEPFDCAVCLCEFSDQDKLRLLPLCSHAFHTECIDTWLLSNSTCPLCRGALCTPTLITGNPIFGFEECREEDGVVGLSSNEAEIASEKGKVFNVRLGKFRSSNDEDSEGVRVDGDVGESSSSNLDARRCFSMGSYQYVVADSELQVTLPSNRTANDGDPRISEARDGFSAVGMKDSFSVSKIWLWSKKDSYSGSSNMHIGNHTSVNMSLPWKNVA